MNEQELFKALTSVLNSNMEESVYLNDNGTEYKVDLTVKDNVLDLHIEEELFQTALERTVDSFDVKSISEIEDKEELKEVFKNMVSKIATEKIEQLKQYV